MLKCLQERTNVNNVEQMQSLINNGGNGGRYKVSSNFLIEHFDELSNREISKTIPSYRVPQAISTTKKTPSTKKLIHFKDINLKIIGETFISRFKGCFGISKYGLESLNQKPLPLKVVIKKIKTIATSTDKIRF